MKNLRFIIICIALMAFLGLFIGKAFAQSNTNPLFIEAKSENNNKDIQLNWVKKTDVEKYDIKRDGTIIHSATQNTYTDRNVSLGNHTYTINGKKGSNIIVTSTIKIEQTATGVKAQGTGSAEPEAPSIGDIEFPSSRYSSIGALALAIATWLLAAGGAVAVLAVAYSGLLYITAGGNADQAGKARKNLTWAITGLVIIILSIYIVVTVNRILNGPTTVQNTTNQNGTNNTNQNSQNGNQNNQNNQNNNNSQQNNSNTNGNTNFDIVAPSFPKNVKAKVINTEQMKVLITWDASTDNFGVTGYKVYRGNDFLGSTAETSYEDTTAQAGQNYNYQIEAYDAAGNVSPVSDPASIKKKSFFKNLWDKIF